MSLPIMDVIIEYERNFICNKVSYHRINVVINRLPNMFVDVDIPSDFKPTRVVGTAILRRRWQCELMVVHQLGRLMDEWTRRADVNTLVPRSSTSADLASFIIDIMPKQIVAALQCLARRPHSSNIFQRIFKSKIFL
jgi:hypothetical protein